MASFDSRTRDISELGESRISSAFTGSKISRRTLVAGTAWTVPTLVLAQATPAWAVSEACQPPGTLFDSQSRGRLLSGTIGGTNLDAIVAVEGVHAVELAGGAPSVTLSSPLAVNALDAIQVDLTGVAQALSSILTIVAGVDTGAVNQFAHAHEDATVTGASGAVNDATGVLTFDDGSTGVPELASLDLRSILANLTGNPAADLVSQVTDLRLVIGAIAGRAWMSSLCVPPLEGELTRDYLLSYLRLVLESPVVGTLLTSLTAALDTLQIDTQQIWNLLNSIPVLGPVLAALGQNTLDVELTLNTSVLTASPIPQDATAALQVDLGHGTATVDVGSLLGGAYSGDVNTFLNNLAPNTRLFIDAGLPGGAITNLLNAWVDQLITRIGDALFVSVSAGSLGLLGTGLLIEGTLNQLLAGEGTVTVKLLGVPVELGSALGTLLTGVGGIVKTALETLLRPGGALSTLFAGLNLLLSALFTVLEELLVITVNAQNEETGVVPNDFLALPLGRYDVASLHLGLVGFADVLDLFLARGSVGVNTSR